MEKTMKIEGMMCGHCEARVKKALEALPQVTEAEVSHKKGTAVVTLAEEISDAELTKAVEEQDYTVTSLPYSKIFAIRFATEVFYSIESASL